MIFGSVLSVFALMMVSLAQDYYNIFLSQGVALGIGLGTLFLPSVGVISHHFAKRRALATGIVVSGSSCGGVVFPVSFSYSSICSIASSSSTLCLCQMMLNKLFDGSAGFGWAVRATAVSNGSHRRRTDRRLIVISVPHSWLSNCCQPPDVDAAAASKKAPRAHAGQA